MLGEAEALLELLILLLEWSWKVETSHEEANANHILSLSFPSFTFIFADGLSLP